MNEHLLKLTFLWDEGPDEKLVIISTPKGICVTKHDIQRALEEGHEYLCHEDEEDRYGINGCNPETLVEYVCKQHGWKWHELEFESELKFN